MLHFLLSPVLRALVRSHSALTVLALLVGTALVPGRALAQPGPVGQVGNEWIRAGQPYVKLKVGQRGIHRLNLAWLTAAGLPVATLDPKRLQLWRRGQEQAIYVAGEADGHLDAADYVDFWGALNDGRLDAELFKNPSDQMTHLSPLYVDTAAYFLTVAPVGTLGRRMQALTSTTTGLTPQRYHLTRLLEGYQTEYLPGQYYDVIEKTALPWLDKTEGFAAKPFPATSITMTLTLPAAPLPADTARQRLMLDLVLGSNNEALTQSISVSIVRETGTPVVTTVLRTITGFSVTTYSHQTCRVPLRYADLTATGILKYRVNVAPAGAAAIAAARLVAVSPNALAGAPRTVFTDSTRAGASQYLLFDTPPAGAIGYDVTTPNAVVRISGQTVGAQWGLVVPTTPAGRTREVFVAKDAAPLVPPRGRLVGLRILAPVPKAFLIVTDKSLLNDTATQRNPVRDYALYRASTAGGRHDTVTMTTDQVYDHFHYGDASPNAIRRFAVFMTSGPGTDGHLLLIGKGYDAPTGSAGTKAEFRNKFNKSKVPSFGLPASDVSFTADYQNNHYHPRVPTGRLVVLSADQVTAYLEKVKAHDAAPDAPWRKEILHLGGGKTSSEQSNFRLFLDEYKRRAEDSLYLGGRVTSIVRGNTGQNVTSLNVSAQINRGLSLLTFFGHSSANTSDIDIGRASDLLANYNNAGRYPMLLMNGCGAGNAFVSTLISFGEDWVNTPQRGAIGFMALGADGFPSFLHRFTGNFYKAAFNDSVYYGRGLGDVHQRTIELSSPANGIGIPIELAQITEWIFQGDPAARLYTPPQPDYAIYDSTAQLLPLPGERLTARATGVQVALRVRNYGKFTADSVRVEVRRSFPGGPPQVVARTFGPIGYGDTLLLTIPNQPGVNVQGTNSFEILVDEPNAVPELNELNNVAHLRYTFPSGSVFPLFPQEFAIVPTTTPGLVGEYDQPLAQNRDYAFELDTVPTFRSPVLMQHSLTAGRYPIWRPTLPVIAGHDSLVWYWRFRPTVIQPGEDSAWATSSFRHIAASPGGWSQSHYGQMVTDSKVGLSQAAPSGKWSYSPALLRLLLRTQSGDSLSYLAAKSTFVAPPDGIFYNQSSRMLQRQPWTNSPNMFVMVFDPRSLEPVTFHGLAPNTNILPIDHGASYYGQQSNLFDFAMLSAVASGPTVPIMTQTPATGPIVITARVDTVAKWIDQIPTGYIIALVTANRVPFDEIRAQRPALLNNLRTLMGSRLVDSLHSGDPFVIVATKGMPGTTSEKTYDHSLPRRWKQAIILDTVRQTFEPRGRVASTVIGPVQQWHELHYTIKKPSTPFTPMPTSTYALNVVPIDTGGHDGPPIRVTAPSNSSFRLDTLLNVAQYPKARLELFTEDTVNRLAPQLKQWLVTYDEVPEGIVRADSIPASALDLAAQVEAGAVKLRVPFENISTVAFGDSVTTEFTILQLPSRSLVTTIPPVRVKMARLAAGALGWTEGKVNISRLPSGNYVLRAVVNPGFLLPERYDFNNTYEVPFPVEKPNLAPLVDVAFDGQHILHGDIVAPAPVIAITVRDESKEAQLNPQDVKIFLTRPGTTVAEQIPTSSPLVRIRPATTTAPLLVTYEPGRLADGVYKLDVQATDPDGNLAGKNPYSSEFRVINETMISNFYPYPNPFSTSTRFLFTVTGRVPQNLKIQIMTVTGRVVREITKAELGTDLRVGNNTGTTAWNGTDEYGDPLANGVYLYRVVVQDDADEFKSYKTAGDNKAFHKTWGKLYILR